MSGYARVKWIESEDGIFALEVLQHPQGHAQFRIYRRHKAVVRHATDGNETWTQVQDSGVYADPESAESDGLLQWGRLPKSQFAGMTTNERLFVAGLLRKWDAAVRAGDRNSMIELLSKVELSDQAASIADSTLKYRQGSPP